MAGVKLPLALAELGLIDEYELAVLTQQLADKPWGGRELGVRTPEGHRIMFGQELRQ